MTGTLPPDLRDYLAHPSLQPVWARVRRRLEGARLTPIGVTAVDLDEVAADRLAGLLGRAVRAGAVRLRLDELDAALRRSAAAAGLVAVLEQLTGPLTDRAAARELAAAEWAEVRAALDDGLARAGLADAPWVPSFLEQLTRAGVFTRAGVPAARAAVGHATATLTVLAPGSVLSTGHPTVLGPRRELAELAGSVTGDAHGLDDGRLAAALVLRAIAAATGTPPPTSAAEGRSLWETAGVTTDQVSGTVLIWGLRPPGTSRWAAVMRERADLGLVTHLTVQELRAVDGPLAVPGQRMHACENPQVLQAAAHAGVPGPLLCLLGNPSAAGLLTLARLVDGDVPVAYHGDFDWPGVGIASRLIARGVHPWRLFASDYLEAVAALPADGRLQLSGAAAATPWDPQLGIAMRRHTVAVHEEAVLASLIADLG